MNSETTRTEEDISPGGNSELNPALASPESLCTRLDLTSTMEDLDTPDFVSSRVSLPSGKSQPFISFFLLKAFNCC